MGGTILDDLLDAGEVAARLPALQARGLPANVELVAAIRILAVAQDALNDSRPNVELEIGDVEGIGARHIKGEETRDMNDGGRGFGIELVAPLDEVAVGGDVRNLNRTVEEGLEAVESARVHEGPIANLPGRDGVRGVEGAARERLREARREIRERVRGVDALVVRGDDLVEVGRREAVEAEDVLAEIGALLVEGGGERNARLRAEHGPLGAAAERLDVRRVDDLLEAREVRRDVPGARSAPAERRHERARDAAEARLD